MTVRELELQTKWWSDLIVGQAEDLLIRSQSLDGVDWLTPELAITAAAAAARIALAEHQGE